MTERMSVKQYLDLVVNNTTKVNSKYKNKRVCCNGKSFDSKMEANYYIELLGQWIAGELLYFLRQVPLDLSESTKLVYKADFLVFYNDGGHEYIDVKGVETKEFKLKSALVESRYNKSIVLVRTVKNYLMNIPCDLGTNSYQCLTQSDFLKYRIRTF